MGKGSLLSAGLHLIVILIAIFGLPMFSNDWEPPVESIPVELATIAEMTNIPMRPEPKKPVEKDKPKPEPKPEPPKPTPAPPPPPPPAPEPEPLPEDAVPLPKDKVEEKPEPKPEAAPERVVKLDGPRPKVKPKRPLEEKPEDKLDLNKIAALLDKELDDPAQKTEETEEKPEDIPQDLPPTQATRPTTSAQMTLSEIDSIRAQIEQCWIVPAGAQYAENLVVRVRIFLRPDGGLAQPPQVVDSSRMGMAGQEAYRTAAESAVRAILKCEPFKNLPVEKYDRWQDIELNFDPRSMLGG